MLYPNPTALSYPNIALDWFGWLILLTIFVHNPSIYDFYSVWSLLYIYAIVSQYTSLGRESEYKGARFDHRYS